uniref:UPAR/Ly6 domain-containing protein n=1 Tax=Gadus morhua TaxID=8049 RepID=A0A8C5AAP8_GADMO
RYRSLLSAVADSLDCNKCSVGLVGICLNSNTLTCTTNTSVCFTGKATFPSISSFSGFNTQGCREPAGCNMTSSSTLLGANVSTTVTCCASDKCNPTTISSGTSVQLSLTAACVAVLASLWAR